jgi:hypothetical protein
LEGEGLSSPQKLWRVLKATANTVGKRYYTDFFDKCDKSLASAFRSPNVAPRQGLRTEGLQTPPGPEGSNGSVSKQVYGVSSYHLVLH